MYCHYIFSKNSKRNLWWTVRPRFKKLHFSFLKSRVVWFKKDLCTESKNRLSDKNAWCRQFFKLKYFLNRECILDIVWNYLRLILLFRLPYSKVYELSNWQNHTIVIVESNDYLRKINSSINFKWLSKIPMVNSCSQMLPQTYANHTEDKNDEDVERCHKICEEIFIHSTNFWIIVHVNNLEHKNFCTSHPNIHVCAKHSKFDYQV